MNKYIKEIFLSLLLFKTILFYFFYDYFPVYNAKDADSYHGYAIGLPGSRSYNIWSDILRWLNNVGLYDRDETIYLIKFFSIFIVPYLGAKLVTYENSRYKNHSFFGMFFLLSIYPSLNYFSIDVYRDVIMVFLFLIGLFFLKYLSNSSYFFGKILVFLFALILSYILYLFRRYLGFSYAIALLATMLYSFRNISIAVSIICFFILLNIFYYLGYLDQILLYRKIFKNIEQGAGLGIKFYSWRDFNFNFIKSFIYQLLGFYFVNISSVFVFFIESVPFVFALIYVVKNKKYADKFLDYLVIFFVVYSSIWVLGNDNLGTAVRLRIPSYLSIAVSFFVIYQNKNKVIS